MPGEFHLGPWLVQPDLNTITRNDTLLRLEPKIMDVLVFLSERRGQVVPKEELIRGVWSDAFVTEDTLTRCIYELRKVLEDDVRHPTFIQTVPRRGYRLIPAAEEPEVATKPANVRVGTHTRPEHLARPSRKKILAATALLLILTCLSGIMWRKF